jgi:hypothetical protein
VGTGRDQGPGGHPLPFPGRFENRGRTLPGGLPGLRPLPQSLPGPSRGRPGGRAAGGCGPLPGLERRLRPGLRRGLSPGPYPAAGLKNLDGRAVFWYFWRYPWPR